MLPVFNLATPEGRQGVEAVLARLRQTASMSGDAAATVAAILQDVRKHGDTAVVQYMQKWTDPAYTADRIRVDSQDIANASPHVDAELLESIKRSIDHVTRYQQHIKPADSDPLNIAGATLSMRHTPVDSAALCVPGGTAVLFSTLIMLAVPAIVAGVDPKNIAVLNPPLTKGHDPTLGEDNACNTSGGISPVVLATCNLLGINKVYRIGGAQAVAAAAFGTESVDKVDLIAGPGNIFVQLAKAQVAGVCGTDNGFYGPSEIVTLADETARPDRVAADLIAQAEHDPGKCFLISTSSQVIDNILSQIERQIPNRSRRAAIEAAFTSEACAVVATDLDQAIDMVNTFAGEHVNLAVADPQAILSRIRHGGEIFLGDATPVASGDYYAGPSHCLPTGTTARFTSGVSCHTFLKRTGLVSYGQTMPKQAIDDIARMAQAEGLDGHAESARVRGR